LVINVPNLRFKFDGEWKSYCLSDVVNRITRKNKNQACKLPLTISAQYGLIDQTTFFDKKVASQNLQNYYLLLKGDFAYNKSYSKDYPWGAVKKLNFYDAGVVSNLYICFRPNDKINSSFLEIYFESDKWYKQISDIAGEGARNHGLLNMSTPNFFETRHRFPCVKEQVEISAFIKNIDERIEVQNKIINELSSLSISIKTIVFSRWIHCPKIAIAHVVKEYDEKTVTDDMYPVLSSTSSGLYLQTDYFNKNASSDCTIGYKIVPFGYCTYRSMSDTGNFNFNKQNIIQNGLVSPAYPVFLVEKCSTDFLLELLNNNDEIKKQIMKLKSGGTRFSLSFKKLSELKIPWPDQKEREQATRLFDSVNKQLINERMLLESLKREKSFLLRNLFI
jgi:type I restriction enzyme S subunit